MCLNPKELVTEGGTHYRQHHNWGGGVIIKKLNIIITMVILER